MPDGRPHRLDPRPKKIIIPPKFAQPFAKTVAVSEFESTIKFFYDFDTRHNARI
jgi:hypothetical protein